MKNENKNTYLELVRKFNLNSKYLAFEIGLNDYLNLKKQYNAENRNHLAKILANRNIILK